MAMLTDKAERFELLKIKDCRVYDIESHLMKLCTPRRRIEPSDDEKPGTPRVPKFASLLRVKAAPIRQLTLSNVGLTNLAPILPMLTSAFMRKVDLSFN